MEYSPMMLVLLWALTPSESWPVEEAAKVEQVSSPSMTIENQAYGEPKGEQAFTLPGYFTFNNGRPFLADKDPLTGNLNIKTTPVKIYHNPDDYFYEDNAGGDSIDRKDGDIFGTKIFRENDIKNGGKQGQDLHQFLNLPVHYSTQGKFPLISSSYANTKVQGHGSSSYSNHKPHSTKGTTVSPNYYTHKTQSVSSTSSPVTSTTTTTVRPSTTTNKPSSTPVTTSAYDYEYVDYDYSYDSQPAKPPSPSSTTTKAPIITPVTSAATTTTKLTASPSTTTTKPTTVVTTKPTTPVSSTTRKPTISIVTSLPINPQPDEIDYNRHSYPPISVKLSTTTHRIEPVTTNNEIIIKDHDNEKPGYVNILVDGGEIKRLPSKPGVQVVNFNLHQPSNKTSYPGTSYRPERPDLNPEIRPDARPEQRPPWLVPPFQPLGLRPPSKAPTGQPSPQVPPPQVKPGQIHSGLRPNLPSVSSSAGPSAPAQRPVNQLPPNMMPSQIIPGQRPLAPRPFSETKPVKEPEIISGEGMHTFLTVGSPTKNRPVPFFPGGDGQHHYPKPVGSVENVNIHVGDISNRPQKFNSSGDKYPDYVTQTGFTPEGGLPRPPNDKRPGHFGTPSFSLLPQDNKDSSYSLQTSFSIGVPQYEESEDSKRPLQGIGQVLFPDNDERPSEVIKEPPRRPYKPEFAPPPSPPEQHYPRPPWQSHLKPPYFYQPGLKKEPPPKRKPNPLQRHDLPNILPQFRPNAKVDHRPPTYVNKVREPLDTLQPPPLPRPQYLRLNQEPIEPAPLVHRRTGQQASRPSLPPQPKKPALVRADFEHEKKGEEPVFVVYPSKVGDHKPSNEGVVVVGTRGAQRPLPPDNLDMIEDTFPLEDRYNARDRVDTPILKSKATPKPLAKPEFPYEIVKPEKLEAEETSYVQPKPNIEKEYVAYTPTKPHIDKEYLAYSPTKPHSDKEYAAYIASKPQLIEKEKEYTAYSPTVSSSTEDILKDHDSEINLIPYLQDYMPVATKKPLVEVVRPNTVRPISVTLKTSSTESGPKREDFEAPFQASVSEPSHGWSVVTSSDHTTTAEAPTTTTPQPTKFDVDGFKPMLIGGFKPILPPSSSEISSSI